MAGLPQWISLDGAVGDLPAILPELATWAELAQHWRDIAAAVWKLGADAPVDSPARLAAYLADHLADDAVVAVFAGLGLTGLHERLAAIETRLRDPQAPWHKLLQPVSDFSTAQAADEELDAGFGFDAPGEDGEITLEIPRLAPAAATALGPAALTFDLGVEAGLSCEAGSPWPFRSDDVEGGLLRIGGQGRVSTRAGLSLPFGQAGSGTAHAGASGEAALGFFFRPPAPTASFAEVLVKAVGGLPDPLDLDAIAHSAALAGLEGIALGCRGAVDTGLGIVLGRQFEIARLASGTLGVTADISFRRNSQWILSLRQVPGGLRFVLSRDERSERDWAAGLELSLDAAPLARRVHDLLIEGRNFAGPMLERIKPFLSPGTYLATQAAPLLKAAAASIVDQDDVRDALEHDLAIALGASDGDSSALVTLLTDKLATHATAAGAGVLGDAGDWAQALVDSLTREVPALAATGLADKVKARIEPLLKDVKTAFDAQVAALADDPALAAGLAAELSAIGTAVKAAERDADKLMQGVREAVGRFQRFADEVIAATGDGAKARLKARFGWAGGDDGGLKYELSGTFTKVTPETARLWRALVTGQLKPFQAILADPSLAPAGLTLAGSSSLSRFTSRERGFAAEIVVLGVDVSIASIVRGEATITTNAAGDIAVTSEGSAMRKIEGFDEGRSATFISTWDLLLAKADGALGQRRAMAVEVGLDHSDKDLKPREVEGMLAGLRDQGLIDASRVELALATYQSWRVAGAPGGKIRGRIGIRMQLPGAAVESMIALGRQVVRDDRASALAIFERATACQIAAGVTSRKQFERDIDTARDSFTISVKTDDPYTYMIALLNSKTPLLPDHNSGPRLPALAQLIPRAGAYMTMLKTMAEIHDAVPAAAPGQPGAWSEKDYADAQKRLASAARKWLKLNADFLFWFKSPLHPAILAFFRLLAETSGADFGQGSQMSANRLFQIIMTQDGAGIGEGTGVMV